MTLLVATNASADAHREVPGHPERSLRTLAALDGLVEAGLSDLVIEVPVREATSHELHTVHSPAYLGWLEELCAGGGGRIDDDTYAAAGSWETALLSAGAGLAVIERLRGGEGAAGLVLARPPGHHARPAQAMGFCLLNNIAVAAAALVSAGERVLILDWDVHHGNGTQEIFWDDPSVLFVSTHQEAPFWPGTGRPDEVGGAKAYGLTINLPLPAGTTGDVLGEAIDRVVAPAVRDFTPSWVLVSCGFDGHRADPIADWSLTAGDYADLASRAAEFAPAPGRVVLFLEGGYDLDAVRVSTGAAAAALVGESFRPEPASVGGRGHDQLEAAIQARVRELS